MSIEELAPSLQHIVHGPPLVQVVPVLQDGEGVRIFPEVAQAVVVPLRRWQLRERGVSGPAAAEVRSPLAVTQAPSCYRQARPRPPLVPGQDLHGLAAAGDVHLGRKLLVLVRDGRGGLLRVPHPGHEDGSLRRVSRNKIVLSVTMSGCPVSRCHDVTLL